LKVLEDLGDKFSKKYWNDIKPDKKAGVKVASPTPTKKILGRGGKTVVMSSGTTTPALTTPALTTPTLTTPATATRTTPPANTLVTGKQTFIPVPAHQKLAPQSQHDLVLTMKEVKAKLNATNLDALLDDAVVTSESGIANMICTLREAVQMLENIKVKAKPKQAK
jgi:hypothetical protein